MGNKQSSGGSTQPTASEGAIVVRGSPAAGVVPVLRNLPDCIKEAVGALGITNLAVDANDRTAIFNVNFDADRGRQVAGKFHAAWTVTSEMGGPRILIRGFTAEGVPVESFNALSEYVVRANYGMLLGHFDVDTSDRSVAFNINVRFLEQERRDAIVERLRGAYRTAFQTWEKYEPGLFMIQRPPPGTLPDARAAIARVEGAEAGFDLTALGCPPIVYGPAPLAGLWRRVANADFDGLVGKRVRLAQDPSVRYEREDAERGPLGPRLGGGTGVVTSIDGSDGTAKVNSTWWYSQADLELFDESAAATGSTAMVATASYIAPPQYGGEPSTLSLLPECIREALREAGITNITVRLETRKVLFGVTFDKKNGRDVTGSFDITWTESSPVVNGPRMLIRAYAVDGFPRAVFPALSEFVTRANYGMNLGHFDIDTSDYSVAFNANVRFAEIEPRDSIVRRIRGAFVTVSSTWEKYESGLYVLRGPRPDARAAIAAAEGADAAYDLSALGCPVTVF